MSDADPRPVDLRPKEFESPPDDPFANDRLNRKESVESLCTIIQNARRPLVVSVEGAYGTGKSSFLRMCASRMSQLGAWAVEFNAWQQGHTGRPLIDLVAALSTRLADRGSWDKVKDAARHAGWRTAGYLTRGIVAPIEADSPVVFQEWADIDDGVAEFRASLREEIEAAGKKLVILVDELDRCEPTYALDLLNKARHLFDIDGVVIVFGVNREELGHAVETLYGPKCDVDGYLRRFVDLSMQLQLPTTVEWAAYMTSICDSLLDCTRILGDESNTPRVVLTLLADNCGGRLRDIEQIVRQANLALPPRDYNPIWPLQLITMLALRYLDRDSYERFVAGDAGTGEVLLVMREHLTKTEAMFDMTFLDAVLLLLHGDQEVPRDENAFVEYYQSIRKGEIDDAKSTYGLLQGLRRHTFAPMSAVETLHKIIEIAAPI
ncbi:KAP family P-loop NTPase fold protein [Candidatus Poriferisodalis sp.]|uniref:KAP family P-loop NTPase fold protein n=1 Tax=Candidatus Poriferisodalis sp. TaxID=3101277 RepID=UPI003B029215